LNAYIINLAGIYLQTFLNANDGPCMYVFREPLDVCFVLYISILCSLSAWPPLFWNL